jgi:hypothetical protein
MHKEIRNKYIPYIRQVGTNVSEETCLHLQGKITICQDQEVRNLGSCKEITNKYTPYIRHVGTDVSEESSFTIFRVKLQYIKIKNSVI